MPTHGPELGQLSISQIVTITGFDARTIALRLRRAGLEPKARDGRSVRYDPRLALPILYDAGNSPQAERARLDRVRADLLESDLAVRRSELIPLADHEAAACALTSAVTQRMRAIPSRAAPLVRAAESDEEGETVLRREIDEALSELADVGEALDRGAEASPSGAAGDGDCAPAHAAAADLYGEPVGGRGEAPLA